MTQRGNAIFKGIDCLEESLRLDPEHGLAWSCMADAHLMLGFWGFMAPEVARRRCTEAVTKAMRYAPDVAETHCSQALYSLLFDWDWRAAERAFERSLELNPGYTQGSAWYQMFYRGFVCGEFRDGAAELAKALAHDQYSGYGAAALSQMYSYAGDSAAADAWATRAEELAPATFFTPWTRQLAAIADSDWPRAIRAGREALALSGRLPSPLAFLGISLLESGDIVGARAIYDELNVRAVRETVSSGLRAILAAAFEEDDAAGQFVRDAVQRRDPSLVPFFRSFPGTRKLQELPEYQRLVASLALPGMPVVGSRSPRGDHSG